VAARKPAKARKSRSGSYVPERMRGTVRVVVRCSVELAERTRRAATAHGLTLAEVLERGVEAVTDGGDA